MRTIEWCPKQHTGFVKEFYNTTFEYLKDSIPLNEFSFTPTNFTLVLKIRLLEIRLDLNGEKNTEIRVIQ
jgi:hypothetical protein